MDAQYPFPTLFLLVLARPVDDRGGPNTQSSLDRRHRAHGGCGSSGEPSWQRTFCSLHARQAW